MYASHKKDINRHKSFHPLTGRNLGKVEQRQEEEELKKKASNERIVQLRQDQEKRRYDELIMASSGEGISVQLAKFRQVENIFAAETKLGGCSTSDGVMLVEPPNTLTALKGSNLTFKKEESHREGCKNGQKMKREREDTGLQDCEKGKAGVVTGFLSTADSVQLRKELDRLKKESHDPLRRIERFQNRTVAAEAKRRALDSRAAANEVEDSEKSAIRLRIQELLNMKKHKV